MTFIIKDFGNSLIWCTLICVLLFSCKKENVEREIDAFSDLNLRVEYVEGQYILHFRLAKFNYKNVNVKLSQDLNAFHLSSATGKTYSAVGNHDEYTAFFDPLNKAEIYFYQIIVQDHQDNLVVSEVYSFNTR